MIAPEKKIIIDKGADYEMWIQVPDGEFANKDVRNWKWTLRIMNDNKDSDPTEYKVIEGIAGAGTYTPTTYNPDGSVKDNPIFNGIAKTPSAQITVPSEENDARNGWIKIKIDSSDTFTYDTRIEGLNKFITEYNYFYTITIYEPDDDNRSGVMTYSTQRGVTREKEELRIARGQCAVRI